MMNLEPAINYFGTQKALAEALGLNPMAITQWKRRKSMHPKWAKKIADITNNEVNASDLLPEFFTPSTHSTH